MGLMTSYRWRNDPRTVLFMLARYKFVSKLLEGYGEVLEVGCGDGFGANIVRPAVRLLVGIDQDAAMIASAKANYPGIIFRESRDFDHADAIYSLDVIEHIPHGESIAWVQQMPRYAPVAIIGSPSIESQPYASKLSRENHINCMTASALKTIMQSAYKHVFMFSMSDEVVHTGFSKMSHYNFALGVN